MQKETEQQDYQGFSSTRKEAVEELIVNLEGWNERYNSSLSVNDTYTSDLEGIQNLVEDQKVKSLDMNIIRDVLEQAKTNLQNFDYEVAIVNALIDEIKMAELKWAEFEDKEALRKRLFDIILPKIDELQEAISKQSDLIGQVDADLVPMRQTVEKTTDNNDYKEEEDHWNQILRRIENELENQSLLIRLLDDQREYLNELLDSKDTLPDSEIEISELEAMKTKIEETIEEVNNNIVTNNEILERTQGIRADIKDVSTSNNFEVKYKKNSDLVILLDEISSKVEAVRERIDNELQDEKLNENQADIIQNIEESYSDVNRRIQDVQDE